MRSNYLGKILCFSGRVATLTRWMAFGFLLVSAPGRLGAQSTLMDAFNPLGNAPNGIHLYGVSLFAGWESTVNPQGGLALPGRQLKGDGMFGGGASMGWAHSRGKYQLSIGYSANYAGQIRYSDLSALNHSLIISTGRRFGSKWDLGFSGSANLSTFDQMLFTPTLFGEMVAAPGSFDDLAAAVLAGKYSNGQLASLLTGAPPIESPAATALFGDRIFSSALSTSLTYAHSQRLTVSFSASAGRAQALKDGRPQTVSQPARVVPSAIGAGAGVSVSYSLTPRTQIGVSGSTSRGFSQIEQTYATSTSAFVGRTISRHWFAQGYAGSGFVTYLGSHHGGSIGTAPIFGGSLGYKMRAHTFMGAYSRTLSQSYGVGAAHAASTNVAWNWQPVGRPWGVNSSYMREQLTGGSFGGVNGWRASFGIGRNIGRQMGIQTSYSYGYYAMHTALVPYDSAQHAIRVSLSWMPAGERRR